MMNPNPRTIALAVALLAIAIGPQPVSACNGEGCTFHYFCNDCCPHGGTCDFESHGCECNPDPNREVRRSGYTCTIRNSDNVLLHCVPTPSLNPLATPGEDPLL